MSLLDAMALVSALILAPSLTMAIWHTWKVEHRRAELGQQRDR